MWWIIYLSILIYFLIKGNILGILIAIIVGACLLPGIGTSKSNPSVNKEQSKEIYKQGDILGQYSDLEARTLQEKERQQLEMTGRTKIE
ncbi:hypothetical protein [Sutcliffiella rhizosphaerae]|uniref:Uncharacterized protein n=1 Tax=Sutcliffiella rhizosphaerae TaxID=2880967 RepID=A0ABN8ADH9_9BACI|nr:hypothetical protein [Sutcliffiella rhizosphaerae]CAG9621113.1 hypothetical protein BACCIP111883_01885 [Sutcliffiella rhizosphaerae]